MNPEDNRPAVELPQDLRAIQDKAKGVRKPTLTRRKFLGVLGLAVGGTAVASRLPDITAFAAENDGHGGSQRLRRWCMVVDLRYCDGCTGAGLPPQCTQGCIMSHFVPEGMQWVEVFEAEIAHATEGTYFFPLHCQQCSNAPCVNVCPVGATFSTPEGPILIDQERCIGCRMCMAACPYDRRFFNWGHPVQPRNATSAKYDVETQIPAKIGTVMKCDFCPDRGRGGGIPYCAESCPNKAIYYGDLEEDVATNGSRLIKISSFLAKNQAYRYKEELGTQPRVYYIPGHGQNVGRSPINSKRPFRKKDLEWPWRERS